VRTARQAPVEARLRAAQAAVRRRDEPGHCRGVCAAAGRRGPRYAADPAGAEPAQSREQELVTLVAGGTNAQIAIQLYIGIRTVGSHLDRTRDKTGCRRCTDLTRLALQAGLV
jgi:DNA-binding CsgD family transcriptional regulator